MGPKVIAGNWKMHHGPTATRTFFRDFRPNIDPSAAELVVFPPALSLQAARSSTGSLPVALGVQNIHWEPAGALTGEVSAEMASDAGASLALVGHSERRQVFGETDEETARKVDAAWRAGLRPVLCVGETLEEREDGATETVVLRQLEAVLAAWSAKAGSAVVGCPLLIAYEPVWAIGTGRTATPEDASAVHAVIRARLALARPSEAGSVPILYGGSVKPENARDLLAAPEVDGVLVGGASLEADSFARIAEASG